VIGAALTLMVSSRLVINATSKDVPPMGLGIEASASS